METSNSLFLDVLDQHAPIKRLKIKSRSNPFVTPEINQLMKTRDRWHKKAIQTNDKLYWNGYRFFRQEVKRELRLDNAWSKLSTYQSGNRKMHSTETALINVTDNILKAIDEKSASVLVLLGMSKAFDSLNHNLLLEKLENWASKLL